MIRSALACGFDGPSFHRGDKEPVKAWNTFGEPLRAVLPPVDRACRSAQFTVVAAPFPGCSRLVYEGHHRPVGRAAPAAIRVAWRMDIGTVAPRLTWEQLKALRDVDQLGMEAVPALGDKIGPVICPDKFKVIDVNGKVAIIPWDEGPRFQAPALLSR